MKTIPKTISNISRELTQMNKTIGLYNNLEFDSFNRLLTRIEQAIEDEKKAWKETARHKMGVD